VGQAEPDQLLSIGEFARRSRLSVKALRLYDRLGLLTPAVVEPRSRYRRYREGQLLTARLIVLMRRASLPLALAAEILAAPDQVRADLLTAYWLDAEHRFSVQRDLVSQLRASLTSGTAQTAAFPVRVRDVPAQLVVTEKRSVRVTELKRWLPEVHGRLLGPACGELFVIYYGEVNEDSDGPVEACAPVPAGTPGTRTEPGHREAYTTITRAQLEFPQILSAFDAVADWAIAAGLSIAGPPREIYLGDVATAGPCDPVCDIAFPVRLLTGPGAVPHEGPAGEFVEFTPGLDAPRPQHEEAHPVA